MNLSFVAMMLIGFVLTGLSGLIILPWLIRLKASQTERSDGPQSHLGKTGTPTMGGIMFLLVFLILSIYLSFQSRAVIPIAISTLGFGLVGFVDDYIKVVKKRSLGLRAWQKMALQFLVAGILIYDISITTELPFDMMVPFSALFSADASDIYINFGVATVPLLFIIILGTVNGANFTDGLDGLLSSVSLVICIFIGLAASKLGIRISPAAGAMAGALLGFLLYNWHPAKVFMGDTGSLALGGFIVAAMLVMKLPLCIVFVGFIFLAEVLSVIIQVLYFKATKGKRFFRMAPIHHHFELGGWSEIQVVLVFSLVTAVFCAITYVMI